MQRDYEFEEWTKAVNRGGFTACALTYVQIYGCNRDDGEGIYEERG